MARIILASSSPRRNELMQNLQIPYEVMTPDIDENIEGQIAPSLYVKELALLKGSAVLKKCLSAHKKDAIVIAADTVVVCDHCILGKPKDREQARAMITQLSGREHEVLSGICVLNQQTAVSRYASTKVHFHALSAQTIEDYIATKEPYDKAGGYGMQGYAKTFVKKVEGDYYNVVGLPMSLLCRMLKEEFSVDTAHVPFEKTGELFHRTND